MEAGVRMYRLFVLHRLICIENYCLLMEIGSWACLSKPCLKLNTDFSEKLSKLKFTTLAFCLWTIPCINKGQTMADPESTNPGDQLPARYQWPTWVGVVVRSWPLVRDSHDLWVSLRQCKMIPLCRQCLMSGPEAYV